MLFMFTGLGEYVGSHCEHTCNPKLVHVFCDPITTRCECERKYPVRLGPHKGCAKPVNLGDQCFYYKTCNFADQHAECVQIKHNAICQCKPGYHTVTLQRPNKRTFCSPDLLVVTTDIPTLLGVATGLAIFTALICFVLKLFVGAKPRHYANANLAPPILFASDTGIPLSVHNIRSASRASSERGGLGSGSASGAVGANYLQKGSRGVLVPASRAGAARAAAILLISCHLTPEQTQQGSNAISLASVHSSASSTKSYSQRRYEKEIEQKLLAQRNKEAVTPSPRSTDHLLSESQQESDEGWTTKSGDTLAEGTGTGIPIAQGGRSHSEEDSSAASSYPVVSSSLPTTLQGGRGAIGPCSSVDWSQDTDAS